MFSTLFFVLTQETVGHLEINKSFKVLRTPALDKLPAFTHPQEIFSHSIWREPEAARCLILTALCFVATTTNLSPPQPAGNVMLATCLRLEISAAHPLSVSLKDDVIFNLLVFSSSSSQTNEFLAYLTLTLILQEPYLNVL